VGPPTALKSERPLADRLKSPQGTEAEVDNPNSHSASEAVVDIHHNRANLIRDCRAGYCGKKRALNSGADFY
jgi:hypothetical protein